MLGGIFSLTVRWLFSGLRHNLSKVAVKVSMLISPSCQSVIPIQEPSNLQLNIILELTPDFCFYNFA